jgi:hypothetical protein
MSQEICQCSWKRGWKCACTNVNAKMWIQTKSGSASGTGTGVELWGVHTPVGLGQQGCKGVQKNQIQKYGTISKVFPFLKSNWSSQFSAHIAENGISKVLIFQIFWGHTPGPRRELAPLALESLGSQFIWIFSHHPLKNYKETPCCSPSTP